MSTEDLPEDESLIRIVVVDDSALFRLVIRDALRQIPGCRVVGTAKDGHSALEVIEQHQPDMVTLDVEMPGMNGIQTLKAMAERKMRVATLMVSHLTESGAQTTTDALLNGAFDFVLKPSGGNPADNTAQLQQALREKVRAFRESKTGKISALEVSDEPAVHVNAAGSAQPNIRGIVIGTSTGGPEALRTVVPQLSKNLSVPVVIVQHMPDGYTSALARRLNEASEISVVEASHGSVLQPGCVAVAPGGQQMQLVKRSDGRVTVRLTDDPPEHGCHPSVDYLLRTAVDAFDGELLVVIMTGMGRDGAEGCRLVRERGGRVLAQSAESCVVYGMPKSVVERNLVNQIVAIDKIAGVLNREAGTQSK